ncbi:unnamed protein product [Rotaria sp. Silwood1]|nr:unnamed protein product [Rotaria sp. Silwood1]CAF4936404.1 unnamed protein product [Rotaria sp. Silwood1]CAF4951660.1 unnamed protein product [Rotaria sp. Silwood1]
MNDKQKQSNKIRRFCKEYNIELQDESSLSSNPRYERTENYEASLNNDGGITVMYEQNVHQQIFNEVQILPFQSIASDQQNPNLSRPNDSSNEFHRNGKLHLRIKCDVTG